MSSILDLLEEQEREDADVSNGNIPDKLPVSSGVLENADRMCRAVKSIGKGSYEWYGFLTREKDDGDFIANNFSIPERMTVYPGFLQVDEKTMSKTFADLEEENERTGNVNIGVGWIHSHGALAVGFSAEDERNLEKLMNTLRLNSQQRILTDLNLIDGDFFAQEDGDEIIISGYDVVDGAIKMAVKDQKGLETFLIENGMEGCAKKKVNRNEFLLGLSNLLEFKPQLPNIVSFGYSIVVNDNGDHHALISTIEEDPINEEVGKLVSKVVDLEIIDDDSCLISYNKIRNRVKNGVEFRQHFELEPYEGVYYGDGHFDDEALDMGDMASMSHAYSNAIRNGSNPAGNLPPYVPNNRGPSPLILHSRRSPLHGGPATISKTKIKNIDHRITEIVDEFGFKLGAYISGFRDPDRKYTEYMDDLAKYMDSITHSNRGEDLVDAVLHLGPLRSDPKRKVRVPYFRPFFINSISDQLNTNIPIKQLKKDNLPFIKDFINYDENEAIEEWVPYFLENYATE